MISTHQDRQAFLYFLRQSELQPLLGEDVGGVGANDSAQPAHLAHVRGAKADLLRVGSCSRYWVPPQHGTQQAVISHQLSSQSHNSPKSNPKSEF